MSCSISLHSAPNLYFCSGSQITPGKMSLAIKKQGTKPSRSEIGGPNVITSVTTGAKDKTSINPTVHPITSNQLSGQQSFNIESTGNSYYNTLCTQPNSELIIAFSDSTIVSIPRQELIAANILNCHETKKESGATQ